jgi:hypothetical protein
MREHLEQERRRVARQQYERQDVTDDPEATEQSEANDRRLGGEVSRHPQHAREHDKTGAETWDNGDDQAAQWKTDEPCHQPHGEGKHHGERQNER